jgi:outer membrane protein assembly factor BamB
VLTDRGMISAFDAATGEKYYHQQRLPNPYTFKSSPLAVNGKLYMAAEEGDVVVLKLGKTYEVLAVNKMGDEFFISSPIVADNQLYLRSDDELFCIAQK